MHYTPSTYLSYNLKFVLFDYLHPILPSLTLLLCNHKSDIFFSTSSFVCFWTVINLSHFLLQCRKVKSESEVTQSCPTLSHPWTAAYQAPPSMGFSRQEYWSGLPLPSPVLFSKSEQIHLLPIAVSLTEFFCNETSRAWASLHPKIRHHGFWLGSSPRREEEWSWRMGEKSNGKNMPKNPLHNLPENLLNT